MRRCRFKIVFKTRTHQCRNVGWCLGWCFDHFLERFRWDFSTVKSLGARGVSLTIDLSNINRPYVQIDDESPRRWFAISYGNGNSDPVLSLLVNFRKDGRYAEV